MARVAERTGVGLLTAAMAHAVLGESSILCMTSFARLAPTLSCDTPRFAFSTKFVVRLHFLVPTGNIHLSDLSRLSGLSGLISVSESPTFEWKNVTRLDMAVSHEDLVLISNND
ncbi:hypothetical protein BJ508DRAFT_335346 [Ascobolus immersus RN42]|uniref:Uncharacterized protein n=1 Tax=Ascobolus immersus RN42 TaxID=1160509 RepID=A0A3N4HR67_ASCIM|nr:hypothetical protein BJ508DRAFT_335346 [Ascobolus immersus RN42]